MTFAEFIEYNYGVNLGKIVGGRVYDDNDNFVGFYADLFSSYNIESSFYG